MLKRPNLINHQFKKFQRKCKRFSGFEFNFKIFKTQTFFLTSNENFYLSFKKIEIFNWYIKRKLKKKGWIYFPLSFSFPTSKKPLEVWMGKGKGELLDWNIPIKKDSKFLFLESKEEKFAKNLLLKLKLKLPLWSRISFFNQKSVQITWKNLDLFSNNWFLKNINDFS